MIESRVGPKERMKNFNERNKNKSWYLFQVDVE
jgi:hypothetical protein